MSRIRSAALIGYAVACLSGSVAMADDDVFYGAPLTDREFIAQQYSRRPFAPRPPYPCAGDSCRQYPLDPSYYNDVYPGAYGPVPYGQGYGYGGGYVGYYGNTMGPGWSRQGPWGSDIPWTPYRYYYGLRQ